MRQPILEYHQPKGRSSVLRFFLRVAALLSALIGITLSVLYMVGLRIGVTWIIKPQEVHATAWLLPLILIIWPLGLLWGNLLDRWYEHEEARLEQK